MQIAGEQCSKVRPSLTQAWGRMVHEWCFCVKPFMEQLLVVEGAKPSMMESEGIPVLKALKKIVFGRVFPVDKTTWTFRRDRSTTFLAFDADSGIEDQVKSFFKKYEDCAIEFEDTSSWKEFHVEIGFLLGYPKVSREAYGEGKVVPSFYDFIAHAPWVQYPFASFSPATHRVEEAVSISLKNKQVISRLGFGEFILQYSEWFKRAEEVWQKKESIEVLEDLVRYSAILLNECKDIYMQMYSSPKQRLYR